MTFSTVHYRWQWSLAASPEAVWPLVADTNRFDRDTGIPHLDRLPARPGDRSGRVRVRLFQYGVPVEYEQEPFEWQYPSRFSVNRRFTRGPLAELRIEAEMSAAKSGTRLVYQVWARPANLLGALGIPVQIGILLRRRFDVVFREYDRLAVAGERHRPVRPQRQLGPGAAGRLEAAVLAVTAGGGDPMLTRQLADTIVQADELVLSRMRPYEFADYWQADRRAVLDLFLSATRAGMLAFRWDVLCPHCRIPKQAPRQLKDLQLATFCDTCRIDFEADFARSVEVTFRPVETIRPVSSREYCIGGPTDTPHVVRQFVLPPGERQDFSAPAGGRYRLRSFDPDGQRLLRIEEAGLEAQAIRWEPGNDQQPEIRLAPGAAISVENASPDELLFLLEKTAWPDTAATAAEVIARQRFRDLFSDEALRPGERISVGRQAIVFTDLRGSSRLYRQIGDAPAFGHVMVHFDRVREIITLHDGAIVKTLGDSVMAVFQRPDMAVRAARAAQAALAEMKVAGQPLQLKASAHYDLAIAVTLNGSLDYFGATVNAAARLQQLSDGSDLIVTGDLLADPDVQAWLAQSGLRSERVTTRLRGFEENRPEIWRLV